MVYKKRNIRKDRILALIGIILVILGHIFSKSELFIKNYI